jgi:hypothetical protein
MRTTLKCSVFLLIFAVIFSCKKEKNPDILTANFYVRYFANSSNNSCIDYFLFLDIGNPGHFHDRFVYAKNLPKKYREENLHVNVTYYYTKEKKCNYPIINIVKIEKL